MSLSRPVLIKVRTLSICFIIVGLTSAGSDRSTTEMENRERMEHNGSPRCTRRTVPGDRLSSSLLWRRDRVTICLGDVGVLPHEAGSWSIKDLSWLEDCLIADFLQSLGALCNYWVLWHFVLSILIVIFLLNFWLNLAYYACIVEPPLSEPLYFEYINIWIEMVTII